MAAIMEYILCEFFQRVNETLGKLWLPFKLYQVSQNIWSVPMFSLDSDNFIF